MTLPYSISTSSGLLVTDTIWNQQLKANIENLDNKLDGDTVLDGFPVTPSAAPDADYEVANKKYIDDSLAGFQGGGIFLDVPGTPTRVSDTQFTITDTSNANLYDLMLSQWTVLIWMESTTFQCAIVESASYATNTVTVNIIGNSLTAGFSAMKYSIVKAHIIEFIIPGTIATGTDLAKTFYMPCAGYIIAADGYHKTAGTTNSTTYDINDDGSTLFSSKLTIATTATVATLLSATDPSTLIAKDSLITVDCDSVSTTAPVEAYVYVGWFPQSWRYIA